jgi:hypothetical protein
VTCQAGKHVTSKRTKLAEHPMLTQTCQARAEGEEGLTTGDESAQNLEALHQIQGMLQVGVRRHLNEDLSPKNVMAGMEMQSKMDLLMASRLILLVEALINAPHPLPNLWGQKHLADRVKSW